MATFDALSPERGVLTPDEVARRLQVSVKTVQREAARGRLPHCRVGRAIRITETQLQRYLHGESVCGPDVQPERGVSFT